MFEHYLRYLDGGLIGRVAKPFSTTYKLAILVSKAVRKVLNVIDIPEKAVDRLLSRLASKPLTEQKRFVESMFIVHKVAIVLALATLYLMST